MIKTPLQLHPYQQERVVGVISEFNKVKSTLLPMATGTGKTIVYLAVLREVLKPGKRAMVIAHRRELISQPVARIERFFPTLPKPGVVMAEQRDVDADLVIATVQSLNSGMRLNEILAHGKIDYLVTDECFVAGTLIDKKRIETIKVGDVVSGGKVTHVFKNKAPDTLVRVHAGWAKVTCTPNHPFLTEDESGQRAWTPAKDLHSGSYVVQCTIQELFRRRKDGNANFYVPLVQRGIPERQEMETGSGQEYGEGLLLHGARASLYQQAVVRDGSENKSQVCVGAHEAQEPDARPNCERENAHVAQGDGVEAASARGEWSTPPDTPTAIGLRSGMGDRTCRNDERQAGQSATPADELQSGHCQLDAESRNRGRRKLAWPTRKTKAGPQKRSGFTRARVDRVEIFQRGRDPEFERLCPDGFVYNLEVELTNAYIANGFVVHNCHHSTSDTYENVYRRLYEANPDMKHLGVTATPRRADDVRLSDVFETAPDHLRLSLNDAIKMGALVPFIVQGFYIETVSLDHIPQYKGDWSSKGVGEVMSEKAVLDTAVAKWLEHTPGLRTIAFCATTGQAHKTAQWFRDAGVPAESADYQTPKDERAAMQRRFERGETLVLCNFGLWTEGVDWPMAEVALMMRPTQSDSLYIQMAGRVLRTFPGKKRGRILDLAPADARNMVMGGDLLAGVPKPQRKAEDRAVELGIIPAFGIDRKGQGIDGDPDEVLMRVLNYFIQSTLAWKKDDRLATVGLSDTRTLCVVGPDAERKAAAEAIMGTARWNDACQRAYDKLNVYRVYAIEQAQKKAPKYVRNLGTFKTWDDLIPATEEYAQENQDATLAKRGKRWRNLLPTDGQLYLSRCLVRPGDKKRPDAMRRGELAQFITHRLALGKLEQKQLIKRQ